MQDAAVTRDRLVSEAISCLGDLGLPGLTIGAVAGRAGVSTALVHYHYDTKERLLLAASERLASERSKRRLDALAGRSGLEALDALWDELTAAALSGAARAYEELSLYALGEPRVRAALDAHRSKERAALTTRLPALLGGLGAGAGAGLDEMVLLLSVALDGFVRALLFGAEAGRVRAAYDAFWLTLISAGQTGRR